MEHLSGFSIYPSDYGLTHSAFRPHQRETIAWAEGLRKGQVGVVEQPVGSGKTAVARALAASRRIVALCRTKNLQAENYGAEYKFDVLFGRTNYDCVHPAALPDSTADDCLYRDEGMHECEYADECPYLQHKARAAASHVASLNYAYWLTAQWPRQGLASNGGMLVCDEAHELSDLTLDHAGITLSPRDRDKFDLPPFTVIRSKAGVLSDPGDKPDEKALAWLARAHRATASAQKRYEVNEDKRRARQAERMLAKIAATTDALCQHADDWYICSGPNAVRDPRTGAPQPGFVCRPLTARYHFPRYFLSDQWSTLLMSATIGDAQTFAAELGLGREGTDWTGRVVPSVWNPETRPVRVLDAPKMGYKATESDYDRQANVIADAVRGCPDDWAGLVHVTRKVEARLLSQRLSRHGLDGRLWIPNEKDGTEAQIADWNRHRGRTRGALAVSWNFWTGYNGLEERICIAAKTPFPYLGDPYERERMNYSGTFFLQRTAWQLEQGLGRTRRGRVMDYDADGKANGLVAIADMNYHRVRKYLSPALRESLVDM